MALDAAAPTLNLVTQSRLHLLKFFKQESKSRFTHFIRSRSVRVVVGVRFYGFVSDTRMLETGIGGQENLREKGNRGR
jgi:hypothetical protein